MSQLCAGIALALLVLSLPASANFRAPRETHESPSSALYAPTPKPIVREERLEIGCEGEGCRIEAVYRVESAVPRRVTLEFIVPDGVTIEARVGASTASVAARAFDPGDARERDARRGLFHEPLEALHKASFEASLEAGITEITVRYAQPVSSQERGQGYFHAGSPVGLVQYELWPLKEWTLADDFALHARVRMRRDPPGLWARLFGTTSSLACSVSTFEDCGFEAESGPELLCKQEAPLPGPVQRDGHLVVETRLGRDLPDRLTCELGDEGLLTAP